MTRVAIAMLFAACGTTPVKNPPARARDVPVTDTNPPAPARSVPVSNTHEPAEAERRATVRIDPEPGAKHFQGVWLELGEGRRWVIAYRAHAVWRAFEDRDVLVTGHCYRPHGQAIGATHFEVERLRLPPGTQAVTPYIEIGPEQRVRGRFVPNDAPAGSKAAESTGPMFRADDGTLYSLVGGESRPAGTAARVKARRVVLSPYVAATSGPHLWILDVRDPDDPDPDPATAPARVPCPEPR